MMRAKEREKRGKKKKSIYYCPKLTLDWGPKFCILFKPNEMHVYIDNFGMEKTVTCLT